MERFEDFWRAWPNHPRKQARGKCEEVWRRKRCAAIADDILAHVQALKDTEDWRNGYIPAPLVYLNQARWDGAEVRSGIEVDL